VPFLLHGARRRGLKCNFCYQAISLKCRSGHAVSEKLSERTDRFHLLFRQSAQIFLAESIFVQESPQHICKSRTAKVVFAINLFTTLGQVMFQVPQIRRLLDLVGHSLCFLNHFVQLLAQSSVEGFAGDGPF